MTVTSIHLNRKGVPESFHLPTRRAALWRNYDHPVLDLTTSSSVWILANHWTGITVEATVATDMRETGTSRNNLALASHATLLDAAGAPLGTVQSLLGHLTSEFTREVYLHAMPEDQRRAVASVEALVLGPKRTQIASASQASA